MTLSRRYLFSLFAGAAVAPMLPADAWATNSTAMLVQSAWEGADMPPPGSWTISNGNPVYFAGKYQVTLLGMNDRSPTPSVA